MQTKQYLGYLGLAPFALTLVLDYTDVKLFTQSPAQIFIFYSAIILSFVSGTLWRQQSSNVNTKRQLLSNLFSLLAFASLLCSHQVAIIVLATSYSALLGCEYFFDRNAPNCRDYLIMRFHLTALVILIHIIAFLLW
mgnify:CR=1 FL=1